MSGNNEEDKKISVQSQPYTTVVGLDKDLKGGDSTEYFIPHDAVLGLDQGIEPTWTAVHTFNEDANFRANINLSSGENPPAATLGVDGSALKYKVSTSATHEFYVGDALVGQIDNPAAPSGDNSLVSKSYVDQHGGNSGQLSMIVSYGAPLLDPDNYPGWNPSNSVTVYGPSGIRYIVLANEQATISDGNESSSNGFFIFTMGDDKVERLSVQMPAGADNYATSIRCGVHSPVDDTDPHMLVMLQSLPPVEESADFYPVIGVIGLDLIESYAYTRGVPSDNITPAQISVIVDASSSVTNLIMDVVEGSATFDVGGQEIHCEPPITKPDEKRDGWVLVNLYSKSPGVSKIRITAPTVGDEVYAYPSFILPISTQSA